MIAVMFAAALASSGPAQDAVRLSTPEEAAAAAAAYAPNIPPSDGDWRVIWTTPNGATALDVAHIEVEGSKRTVWIATDGAPIRNLPGSYALTRLELDCAAGVARPRWFAVRAASGANIYGFKPSEDFRAWEANSGGAMLAAAACDDAVLAGPGFPTHQAFAAAAPDAP
ncbi:MAG: hypothetical protein ACXW3O_10250 [Brevundimonas sp.]